MLRPRLLTILCYTAMMSLAIGINLLPIFLTSIQHSFPGPEGSGLTQEQLGRLGAVAFSGLVVGILITGPLADRFGAKAFALLGNTLLAVGLGVIAWSPTYGMLLAATCCLGLGAGILDMVLSPNRGGHQSGATSRRDELAAFLLLCGRCRHGGGWHACTPGRPGLARRQPAACSVALCPCLCARRDAVSSADNRG